MIKNKVTQMLPFILAASALGDAYHKSRLIEVRDFKVEGDYKINKKLSKRQKRRKRRTSKL